MFELFVSSVLPQYVVVFCHISTACRVLQCSVTFRQPAVFYSVLSHYDPLQCSILPSPSITEQQHSQTNNRKEISNINLMPTVVFAINFVPYHSSRCTVQWTVIPFNMNCGISVGWKNYCVQFSFHYAYISFILFPFL